MGKEKRCVTCVHFSRQAERDDSLPATEGATGFCTAMPPTAMLVAGNVVAMFPPVHDDMGCGLHDQGRIRGPERRPPDPEP